MPKGRLCRTVCVAGLLGTLLLLAGCDKPVHESGPAVAPQNMDASKQQQYEEFMKQKAGGGGRFPGGFAGPQGGTPGGAPGAPGGAPPSPPGPGGGGQ